MENSKNVFFALLRAGLWERPVELAPDLQVDAEELYRLAEEQSVMGLIAAGWEHWEHRKLARKETRPFMVASMSQEGHNSAMNEFVRKLFGQMQEASLFPVLVKGQGIAQCYARPLWRASGDVDLFLDSAAFPAAKAFLLPLGKITEQERSFDQHIALQIGEWCVELHGSLRCGLSARMDRVIDEIQADTFAGGHVRIWQLGDTAVALPTPDNDALLVFTHILRHFYKGGIGLRQICDWCRLLWTFRDSLNVALLEDRLKRMGLVSEWKAFAAFATNRLGMPESAMPIYSSAKWWKRKARRIDDYVQTVGNFGMKRNPSGRTGTLYLRFKDICHHFFIFPLDSLRFFPSLVIHGVRDNAERAKHAVK